MNQDIIRVGIYLRVSTEEQANSGFSLECQYNDIRKHVGQKPNWKVVRIYKDPGLSGANLERPGLQKMLLHAKSRVFDILALWKFDRLSRDNSGFQVILSYLKNYEIKIVSVSEPSAECDTPFGEFGVGILGLLATMERKVIKARSRMGQRTRVENGFFQGGLAPFGYHYKRELIS